MEEKDVVVVGAGIAGCSLASGVGEAGHDVLVVDAKPNFIPKVCSGLISVRIDSLISYPKNAITNRIKGARFFAGGEIGLELKRSSTQAYVMDRAVLDAHVIEETSRVCDVEFGWRLVNVERKNGFAVCILKKDDLIRKVKAKVVVGADGALSRVRRLLGVGTKLKILSAALAYVRDDMESDIVEIHYDDEFAPGFFAWRIPRNDGVVEYGLGCEKGKAVKMLEKFCARFEHKLDRNEIKAGFIPLGLIDRSVDDNVILLGDAASQVKPFSGGGVIYSLICAKIGSESVIHALQSGDYSKGFFLRNYENVWKKKIGTKIRVGMIIRRLFDSLSKDEIGELLEMIDENKELFLKVADMDFLGDDTL